MGGMRLYTVYLLNMMIHWCSSLSMARQKTPHVHRVRWHVRAAAQIVGASESEKHSAGGYGQEENPERGLGGPSKVWGASIITVTVDIHVEGKSHGVADSAMYSLPDGLGTIYMCKGLRL